MYLLPRIMYPAILALAGMAVTSCGTTLTLDEPIPAIIDVHTNASLSITANEDLGREIARQVGSKLQSNGFYRIQSPDSNTDVRLALSGCRFTRKTNYETCHDHVLDDELNRHHHDRTASSYDIRGAITCRFSSRYTGTPAVRNYYAIDKYAFSSSKARENGIDDLAQQIANDLIPRQRRYTVTIDPDAANPSLEQAAEACKDGNWALGEQLAKQAVAHKPQSAEALFLMGIIERHNNNLPQSSELLAKAAALQSGEKYGQELHRNASIQEAGRRRRTP